MPRIAPSVIDVTVVLLERALPSTSVAPIEIFSMRWRPLADDPRPADGAALPRADRLARWARHPALRPGAAPARGDARLGEEDRPHRRPDRGVRSRRLQPRQRRADPLAASLVRARGQHRRDLHRRVAAGRGGAARRPPGDHPLGDGRRVPPALPGRRLAARSLRHRVGPHLLRRRRLLGDRSQPLPGRAVLRARAGGRDCQGAAARDAAHVAVGLRCRAAALGARRRCRSSARRIGCSATSSRR